MSVFLNPVKRTDTVMKKIHLGSTVCPDAREIKYGENAVFNFRVVRQCYNLNSTPVKVYFVRHQFDVIDHLGLRLPHLICWDQKKPIVKLAPPTPFRVEQLLRVGD